MDFEVAAVKIQTAVADADIIDELENIVLKVPSHLFCVDTCTCNYHAFFSSVFRFFRLLIAEYGLFC